MTRTMLQTHQQKNDLKSLAIEYMTIKERLLSEGYDWEIDWQEDRNIDLLSASDFMDEAAWVVLSSGFKESTVRNRFSGIQKAFDYWKCLDSISERPERYVSVAMMHFGNRRKLEAIAKIAATLADVGWAAVRDQIKENGPEKLQEFPYIGPITYLHLAKNIGVICSKPDRHLVRIASDWGYSDVESFCGDIAGIVGDSKAVVDIVWWRHAALGRA